jgi:hypothetical protein
LQQSHSLTLKGHLASSALHQSLFLSSRTTDAHKILLHGMLNILVQNANMDG